MARLWQHLSFLVWMLIQPALATDVVTHTGAEWKDFLRKSEKTKESLYSLAQRMFMIAGDYNATESRALLTSEVSAFDTLLQDLTSNAPHPTVSEVVASMSTDWGTFKTALEAAAVTASTVTTANLQAAVASVNVLHPIAQQLSSLLSAMAEQQMVDFSPLRVTTSLGQLAQIKRMMLLILSIHAEVDASESLTQLEGAYAIFSDAMTGLLDGIPFVGLLPTTAKCTLQAMGNVIDSWVTVREFLLTVFLHQNIDTLEARNSGVEEATGLVQLVQAAADLYIDPELNCPTTVSDQGWITLIETSSVQAMYAAKIGRLFLQAAYRVNTLDSRVLISDSIVGGTSRMSLLRAGSAAQQLPPPITQSVADNYATMWSQWTQFTTLLADNVQTVSLGDTAILKSVEEQSMAFFDNAMEALNTIEAECKTQASAAVKCSLLRKLGRQRVLLQKMTFEASLQAVGLDVEINRERMLNSTTEFDRSQTEILHGLQPDIPRTDNYCLIWKLKDVQDKWYPLRSKMLAVAGDAAGQGDYSNGRILTIDQAQWSAGVDPMFAVITSALESYMSVPDDDLCSTTQQGQDGVNREQWEAVVRASGMLRAQVEQVSGEYYLRVKSMGENLDTTIITTQEKITQLIGGSTPNMIPAPPTQTILQRLFDIEDGESGMDNGWTHYKPLLENLQQGSSNDVMTVNTKGKRLMFNLGYAVEAFIDAAWQADTNVPGERSNTITMQATLVERMLKETLLLSLNQAGAAGDLLLSIDAFDNNFNDLRDGNGRDNKYLIPMATEDEHVEALANISKDWANLKPKVKFVADRGSVGTSDLQQIQGFVIKLRKTLEPAVILFSTMTIITTKIPVNLMIPLPFSGRWAPGNTMKVATEVAQSIINEQQLMLPNYEIFSSFFDDACDGDVANRYMLKEFASSTAWIGVGGMACTAVCESLAVVTASLFLPAMSFDCSEGQSLSDQELFPSFMRLGTQRGRMTDILQALSTLTTYVLQVTILSSAAVDEVAKVDEIQAKLTVAGLASAALSAMESDLAAITEMMTSVKAQKQRFMYVRGTEAFLRRVLCASGQVATPMGSTWVSEGVKSKAWWAQDDSSLMAEIQACSGDYVKSKYQAAISVTGRASPEASGMNAPLDCYEGYTPQTLHDHVLTHLAAGYPASDPNRTIVTHPHVELISFALDGICAFSNMIRFMLSQGHDIEDLRTPGSEVFSQAINYMKGSMTFSGSTGTLDMEMNDLPGELALWQVVGEELTLVGTTPSHGSSSIETSGVDIQFWSEAPPDPVVEMTAANWVNTLEAASIQQMYGQKMTRLFLQAATRVNTLDSRVLFSDSRVNALAGGIVLQDGSVLQDIPQKWYTASVKQHLDDAAFLLDHQQQILSENVYTVSVSDTGLIADAANESGLLYQLTDVAVDSIVKECASRSGQDGAEEVPCHTLALIGHQRVLLQKMSMEAALQLAGHEVQLYRDIMLNTSEVYEAAHYSLIHGKAPDIPRTQDCCILQQMKVVHDAWLPFKAHLSQIYSTGPTSDLVLSLDQSQWKAGVDPMFAKITDAVTAYTTGSGICTQVGANKPTQIQLESALRKVALLGELSQGVAKDYLFIVKGMTANLQDHMDVFENTLLQLISGWTPSSLPAPPEQSIVDALFGVMDGDSGLSNGWPDYKTALMKAKLGVSTDVTVIDTLSRAVLTKTQDLMGRYIDSAWVLNQKVPGSRADLAFGQMTLVQRMCKEASMISLNRGDSDQLRGTINAYEANHAQILEGNGQTGKRGVVVTTEDSHLEAMAQANLAWTALKVNVQRVANDGSATTGRLEAIDVESQVLNNNLGAVADLYGTETIITTKVPINIMVPLPLTGRWAPGPTMQVAAKIARDIINEQQLMLPGYRIFTTFFDDECDIDKANRAMLSNFAGDFSWIGVAGMGCSIVCESLSVITASLFLPTLSFECSEGSALSSAERFPDFMRLGTARTRTGDILKELKKAMPWWETLAIISGDFAMDLESAAALQASLSEDGLLSHTAFAGEASWMETQSMMSVLKRDKSRIVFFIGTEAFFRKALCAALVVDMPTGVAWVSEGVKQKGWWTLVEAQLTQDQAVCTASSLSQLYQGAVAITGLGKPSTETGAALDCFDGYTASTLNDYVMEALASGYPADEVNKTAIAAPHVQVVNFALDGMCTFAMMVKHMMLNQGHDIEELRTPSPDIFAKSTSYMKTTMDFSGASGRVKFAGNDLPGDLALWQAVGNESVLAGLAAINTAVETTLDTQYWSEAPPDPVIPMTAENWMQTMEQGSVLMMYAEKATRLFLQAAQRVNTLDARVLFSDSRVQTSARFDRLLDGSARYNVPAKWFTEEIEATYLEVLTVWTKLGDMLAANVATVERNSISLIADAATWSATLRTRSQSAMDGIVADCHARASETVEDVPCTVLRVLGNQRVLLQQMTKEANLQGLGQDVEFYKTNMEANSAEYEIAHHDLVHGRPPYIPRTREHCILQQMKKVHDEWIPFLSKLNAVRMGDTSIATLLSLDHAQWAAGVDPMFATITEAVMSYRSGQGVCTQVLENSVSRMQFEAAIRAAGTLRVLVKRMTKEYFFVVKALSTNLPTTIEVFAEALEHLISGWSQDTLPAPPSQMVADKLIAIVDGDTGAANGWPNFRDLLANAQANQQSSVVKLAQTSRDVLERIDESMVAYIDVAWDQNRDVPGARSHLASTQGVLVQKMVEEALLITLSQQGARGALASSMEEFDANHQVLLNGNGLVGKDKVPPTTEDTHLEILETVGREWGTFKPLVKAVADSGYATASQLENIQLSSNNLAKELESALGLFSTQTKTTTKVPVNFMILLPFTGMWAPGDTMRVATTIAQDLINEQQKLLVGYRIFAEFFDDGCDADVANRRMLEQFAGNEKWVGVGGMGCTPVCESLAVITASLFLPTMSFECSAGSTLSDVSLFPNFLRFGTARNRLIDIFVKLRTLVPSGMWDEMAIVGGDLSSDTDRAADLQASMTTRGLLSSTAAANEGDFDALQAVMQTLKTAKRRVIYFIGTEGFFRRFICAARVVATPEGIAWLSEGVKSRGWWMHDDAELVATHSGCTGSAISETYQGGVNIAGLGYQESTNNANLDCFDDYTPATLNAYVKERLAQGYPAGDPGATTVAAPHEELVNFALDGVCAFAFMVKHMLDEGHELPDLRTPTQPIYADSVNYLRNTMDFTGVSGRVHFSGNDLPGDSALWQAIGSELLLAGLANTDSAREVSTDGLTTAHWKVAPPDPIIAMTAANWRHVIEQGSVMTFFAEKAPRLFFQAAQRVNTLDSQVLFSDSRVQALARLDVLLYGSVREDVPQKWFSASVKDQLDDVYSQWSALEPILASNIGTVALSDVAVIADVAAKSEQFYEASTEMLDMVVSMCHDRDATVPCTVLRVMGRQRVLLQKMSKEAMLQGTQTDVEHNRQRMLATSQMFEQSHYDLIHGKAPHIPRTSDYCILQQMKDVHDEWGPFKTMIGEVGLGDTSNELLFRIDTAQWKAGVDPMFAVITSALDAYAQGSGSCTQVGDKRATRFELEAAIAKVGVISEMTQSLAKEYFFVVKGLPTNLFQNLEVFRETLGRLVSGWKSEELPSPPTQDVANALFAIDDGDIGQDNGWSGYKALLAAAEAGVSAALSEVEANSQSILAKAEDAMAMYIDAAWNLDQDVPGTRSSTASGQLMLIQKMSKEAALVSLGRSDRGNQLLATIGRFEANHEVLLTGNTNAGKRNMPKTMEETHLDAMEEVMTAWVVFKPHVQGIAESGYASTSTLELVASEGEALKEKMSIASALYSTMTVTTTKKTIDIMLPLPMTGLWTPGPTMKMVTQIAIDLINEQQEMLPEYRVVAEFLDDECNPDAATRRMLEQFALSSDWIGLGGMACSAVCETLAVITASLFLPTVSFECSDGTALSNDRLFPSFLRLGTQRLSTPNLLQKVAEAVSWWDSIAVVSSDVADDAERAVGVQASFEGYEYTDQAGTKHTGMPASVTTASILDWASLKATMTQMKFLKRRIMFFVGSENNYRRLICAAGVVQTPLGVTWVSDGIKGANWWSQHDSVLLQEDSRCTGEWLTGQYQGALSITGLGLPSAEHQGEMASSYGLDCFSGYTLETLGEYTRQKLAAGYEGLEPVPNPHEELVNFALDGVCILAQTVRHMFSIGFGLEQLRTPQEDIYIKIIDYMRNRMHFKGMSGDVHFEGKNDLPGAIALWQVVLTEDHPLGATMLSGIAHKDKSVEVEVTMFDGLQRTGKVTTFYWEAAPEDPIIPMTATNWQSVLETSIVLDKDINKVHRLFLQAALRVNTLDSRVLFSDARVGTRGRLENLRIGNEMQDIPIKWYTPSVRAQYDAMWAEWLPLEAQLADNVQTVGVGDVQLIRDTTSKIRELHRKAEEVLDEVVAECKRRTTEDQISVPCEKLRLVGNQRVLLQKMDREAVLQGLGIDIEANKLVMMEDVRAFDSAQFELVHGAPGISRTEDYCTLQQLKDVQDIWNPFKAIVQNVFEGQRDGATLLKLDGSQWSAGVDPMFVKIEDAVIAIQRQQGTCTQVGEHNATRVELEEAIKQVGMLSELAERYAKERFLYEKILEEGSDPYVLNMTSWTVFEDTLRHLVSGWSLSSLPAPPSQNVTNRLLAIQDGISDGGWGDYKNLMRSGGGADKEILKEILDLASDVSSLCRSAVDEYVYTATTINLDVPGKRSAQVSLLNMKLQEILKEAAYVSVTKDDSRKTRIEGLSEKFGEELSNLGKMRRLQESDDAEADHANALAALTAKWNMLQPVVQRVAEGDFRLAAITNVTTYAAQVDSSMEVTTELYSVATQTTTKTPVHFMLPLPLTGHWAPGQTMKVAAKIAESLINEQQKLLPGYRIITDVFDDTCDADTAMREMLKRFASSEQWVGLGGMACTSVCELIAIISSSLFVPALSFECSEGQELSNRELYPDFMRLGTRRLGMYSILGKMQEQFGWTSIVIVAASNAMNKQVSELLACELAGKLACDDLESTRPAIFSSIRDESLAIGGLAEQLDSAITIMNGIRTNKERLIYFVGPEVPFRYLICASHVAGVHPGLTWLSEGSKGRSWWSEADAALVDFQPECTPDLIVSQFEGSINFVGSGAPLEADMDTELDCFDGYTSQTLNEHIQKKLQEGYVTVDDPNGTAVTHPHDDLVNLAVDGMCMLAMSVQRMLNRYSMSIEDMRTPVEKDFRRFVNYMRSGLNFQGASGRVRMSGNDLDHSLAAWQVSGNESRVVGNMLAEEVDDASRPVHQRLVMEVNLSHATGLVNGTWAPAPDDPVAAEEPAFPILAVVIPVLVLFFCTIVCFAIYSSRKTGVKGEKSGA